MKHPIGSLLLAIPVTLLAQPALAQDNVRVLLKQLNSQVNELKNQLQQSNSRINELEKERKQLQSSQPQAAPSTSDSKAAATVSSSSSSAATTNAANPADVAKAENKPVVTVGDVKNTIKIPGTNTSIGFGGFVKTDLIYSSVSAGKDKLGDQRSVYAEIPLERAPGEHSQINFHAKESRLWFRSFTPSSWGDVNTFLEMDLFGDSATYTYTPRLRHAYGSIGNLLVGQTWATFINNSVFPDLLDNGGSAGSLTSFRQPQIRWTQPFTLAETPMEFLAAIEMPRSRVRIDPKANADSFSTPHADRYPDMVGRVNFNPDWGAVSVSAMGRQIRTTDSKTGRSEQAWGGAVSLAGKINAFEQDDFRFMFSYGNVLGRYAASNTFEDAAVNKKGDLKLVNVFAAMFSYQHFWSKDWRSTVAYGFSHADQPDFVGGGMTQQIQSAHANLLWSPVSQATFGIEYIYMQRDALDGRDGNVNRGQFSARYNF
jgi:hypothetical protein